MKREKKILKFNKIKIANMNSIKGGDETNGDSVIVACQSGNNCTPSRDEASAINNPCSDSCYVTTLPHNHSMNERQCFIVHICLN